MIIITCTLAWKSGVKSPPRCDEGRLDATLRADSGSSSRFGRARIMLCLPPALTVITWRDETQGEGRNGGGARVLKKSWERAGCRFR